jgi:hypothetical protein
MPVTTTPPTLNAAGREPFHQPHLQPLAEVLGLLYPAPCSLLGEGPDRVAEYLVVPHARKPKLLIPVESRRALRISPRDAVVAAVLQDRVRVTAPVPGTDSIDSYLRRSLGMSLRIGIHIGLPWREPVLQLLAPSGRTVGFARIGTDPATRRLVRNETAALTALSHTAFDTVGVPSVLHTGQWNGHEVLVQTALPRWRTRAPLSREALATAMLEVAYARGTTRAWLATSRYWTDLHERLAGLTEQAAGARLYEVARTLVERCGDLPLTFGAWHGDWSPGHMANVAADGPSPERLLLWHWERFAFGVPLGFDALHHELQRRIGTEADAEACVRDLVTQAPTLLDPFDVVDDGREATALLYLVDLAARHVADGRAEECAHLLPVLTDRVGRLA